MGKYETVIEINIMKCSIYKGIYYICLRWCWKGQVELLFCSL